MIFENVTYLVSCVNRTNWPDNSCKEVLLCGKSNVGKSSLINALCNRKNLAFVGKTPGKTRLLNFYQTDLKMRLVDAPGYGYYENQSKRVNDFSKMMEEYFQYRSNCAGLLLLLDSRREHVDQDDKMIVDLANEFKKPILVVLTKTDKINKNECLVKIANTAKELNIHQGKILLTSSETKAGIDNLGNRILSMIK